jgi:hypothetical protein
MPFHRGDTLYRIDSNAVVSSFVAFLLLQKVCTRRKKDNRRRKSNNTTSYNSQASIYFVRWITRIRMGNYYEKNDRLCETVLFYLQKCVSDDARGRFRFRG